ncbi:MAG: alanine racemase [Caldilinea sp.]|nr:alanine racemase [Caldilinea sp.]MDW8439573.1 alanine racemase [Caldilineaceae bacterium]
MAFSFGFYNDIHTPTLLLDVSRARRNIASMAEKAQRSGVRFRPHFKTHQSAAIGEWFRELGVDAITVSSVEMARYFAAHGWKDILIAFPVNIREIHKINELAQRVHLHLLVENAAAVAHLTEHLVAPVDVWIEVDAGYRRSGVPWDDANLTTLAHQICECERMRLRGLLTHDGGTYAARSKDQIVSAYALTAERLTAARRRLHSQGFERLEISVGDTPACSVLERFDAVDEIRPGNFVFYDWMQVEIGTCTPEEVAVVVACPVVSIHPERNDIVLYGGAVHLSKESLLQRDGRLTFGAVALIEKGGWSAPLPNVWVRSLSQEHGIVHAEEAAFTKLAERIQVGDLLGILPVHSCLAADLLKTYRTLDGERLAMAPIPGAN